MDLIWGNKKRMNKMGSMDWNHGYAKKKNLYTLLIIKILRLRAVRSMVRMSILTLFLLALYWLVFVPGPSSSSMVAPDSDSIITNYFKILPFLCHDLVSEGLIKKGQKGLIVGVGNNIMNDDYVTFLKDNGVDVVTEASLEVDQNNMFDFVFAPSLSGIELIDHAVKNGGLMISLLSNNLMDDYDLHSINNYRIVYLRIFECTVLAMTKLS